MVTLPNKMFAHVFSVFYLFIFIFEATEEGDNFSLAKSVSCPLQNKLVKLKSLCRFAWNDSLNSNLKMFPEIFF